MRFAITLHVLVLTDGDKTDADEIADSLTQTLEDAVLEHGYFDVLDLRDPDPRVTIGESEVTPA